MYKLKNRNLFKKEEYNIKERSYSMLGETIIELQRNLEENETIMAFRNIYLNLKLAVEEARKNNVCLDATVECRLFGNYKEYRRCKNIVINILPEFEYALSKLLKRKIKIEYEASNKEKEATFKFVLKEA